jgi:dynein heavy chain
LEQIETDIKIETPIAYGLHPNAEIDLGTTQCNYMFGRLNELMPREQSENT